MVKTIILIAIVLFSCMSSLSFATDSYICVADKSTGFAFDKISKSWMSANFNVHEGKYLISRVKKRDAWEVKNVGQKNALIWCKNGFSESGELQCKGPVSFFKMSKKTLRYIMFYTAGYWNEPRKAWDGNNTITMEEGDNTPNVQIGKCSPM